MTDGVTITLVLTLKPEAIAGFCDGARESIKETAAFPGFRSLRMVQHKDDPRQVLLIEEWDSEDAYHAYIAWRTETGTMDAVAAISDGPPRLDFWPTSVASI